MSYEDTRARAAANHVRRMQDTDPDYVPTPEFFELARRGGFAAKAFKVEYPSGEPVLLDHSDLWS